MLLLKINAKLTQCESDSKLIAWASQGRLQSDLTVEPSRICIWDLEFMRL